MFNNLRMSLTVQRDRHK